MKRHALITVMVLLSLAPCEFLDAAKRKTKNVMFDDLVIDPKTAECVASIEPDISEVSRRVIESMRLDGADIDRWKKGIKYSALLPRLQFDYQRRVSDSVDVDVKDSVSVTSSGVNIGPTASAWGQDYDKDNNVTVKAIWYLDELVFNRDSLSISSEVRARAAARRDLLESVSADYFELKRLIAIYMSGKDDLGGLKGKIRIEIERLIGNIDVATNGWFRKIFRWKGGVCE